MIPQIDSRTATLLCPHCSGDYLHHGTVEIFDRIEDAKEGTHVLYQSGKVSIDTNLEGNPSSRRDGIAIFFECEFCQRNSVLTLAQHKGQTIIDFS